MSPAQSAQSELLSALRATEGVTRVTVRKGWVVASVVSSSRAVGLAETIREVGFEVHSRNRVIIFR